MSAGKVLFGVLAGTAVSATFGLLFAPEKGSDARQQLSRKSEDAWENLKSKFDDLISSASEEINDAKNEAKDLYAQGKQKVQETKNDLKGSANPHLKL